MNSILTRRSVRKFKKDKVETTKIENILRAAMQAPSAGNQQSWEYIVVTNEDLLKKLGDFSLYAQSVKEAPMAIVVLGNQNFMRFPESWEHDLGASTENILLQSVEEGLGAVWLSVTPLEDRITFIKDLFDLPDNLKPYAVVPIGYPLNKEDNKFVDRFKEDRVHYNKY